MTSEMRSLRGKVAVVGIGETTYYKHGQSPEPEFKLALKAILAAAEDAGIDPRDIDSFASYCNDRNDPSRLAAALGARNCGCPTCSGAAAAAAARPRSATPRRRSSPARPTSWWCTARSRRASSSASARRRRRHRLRRQRADQSVRHFRAGPALRAEGHALHARTRYRAGGAARHRAGLLSSRPVEPARGDVRPAADRGGVRRVALDQRSPITCSTAARRTMAPPR